MKKIFSYKYLTSLFFLVLLVITLIASCLQYGKSVIYQVKRLLRGYGFSATELLSDYNYQLPGKSIYITLNGGLQRLTGHRLVNERYLMDNGHLTYVIPETDVTAMAENTVAFHDALEKMGIPFGYVSTLFKVDGDDQQLPQGVTDYADQNTNAFLSILKENGVNVLDLRQKEKEQGLNHYDLFYRTDHHWKAETGFWAYTQVVDWLEAQNSSFAVDPVLTNQSSYDHTVYENIFCGSAARRVGPLYAGLDDITVITPKFDTYLNVDVPLTDLHREGSYDDTLLFRDHLSGKNMMQNSAYCVYLNEDYAQMIISNQSRTLDLQSQSTPKKLLILKDSTALVVAPFLALSYDEVHLLDLRAFQGDVLSYVEDYQPDMVLIMYNPGALEQHNANMFDFLE